MDRLVEVEEIGSGLPRGPTRSGGKCNPDIYTYYVIFQSAFLNATSNRKPSYLILTMLLQKYIGLTVRRRRHWKEWSPPQAELVMQQVQV
jgi:hypothetical protein